jgi:hypothetical protein
MSSISEVKHQLVAGIICTSVGMKATLEAAAHKLSADEQAWFHNELHGYVVSETLSRDLPADQKQFAPSGFVLDQKKASLESGLPEYRKIYGKTYAKGMASGSWTDQSNTLYGKMPQLIIENLEHIETAILPMFDRGEQVVAITFVAGTETKRVFERKEFENLLEGAKAKLLEVIDRLER